MKYLDIRGGQFVEVDSESGEIASLGSVDSSFYDISTDSFVPVRKEDLTEYNKIYDRHYHGADKVNNWPNAPQCDKDDLLYAQLKMLGKECPP